MKILITGANGLVGRACQLCSINKKYDVSIVSRKSSPFSEIKGFQSLKEITKKEGEFDLVIHCSSATPFNCELKKIPDINSNIDGELGEFINRASVKQVIYLSTMAVYGDIEVDFISENTIINNPNLYGSSKYSGENNIKETCKNKNVRLSIIRLPGVVGKNMPNIFFRRLYESILNNVEVTIRSKDSLFNNSVLDKDIFLTSINLFEYQTEDFILLNHHARNTITLGNLIDNFSTIIGKKCIYKESMKCNPPFLITNTVNDNLIISSDINKMIEYYHLSQE